MYTHDGNTLRNIFQLTDSKSIKCASVVDLGDVILWAIVQSDRRVVNYDLIVNAELVKDEIRRFEKNYSEYEYIHYNEVTFCIAESFQHLLNAGVLTPHPPKILDGGLVRANFDGRYFVSRQGYSRYDKIKDRIQTTMSIENQS